MERFPLIRIPRSLACAALIAVASALLSCGSDSTGPSSGVTVEIVPPTDSIVIGGTATLQAVVHDENGALVQNPQVFWNSENPSVATISAEGVVTAVGIGSVRIAASALGESGLATVTVLRKPVKRVTVSPDNPTITVGETVHLQATTLDGDNVVLADREVTWSSDNASIASVDATGLVTGKTPGTAHITATSEQQSGTATVVVKAPVATSVVLDKTTVDIIVGQTLQLSATVKDANGGTITGAPVTWQSDASGIASVSASGLVTGVAPGSANITAKSGNASQTAHVTVAPVPANAVVVSPRSATLIVGQTQQLTAQVTDAAGDVLTGRTVTWSSNDDAVATVSSSGLVTSRAVGTATISATSEGKVGTSVITVNPVPVASITVTPDQATILQGKTVQLQAKTFDAQGNELPGRTVTWQTSNASVASLSASSGPTVVVTAKATGTDPVAAVITATSEGQRTTVPISVIPVPVASITLDPTSASIAVGGTKQFTATLRDADGNVLTGRTVTWTSTSPGVASVSASGLVTAKAQGTTTIFVVSESKSASADVTVTPPPVSSVTVQPSDTTIFIGGSFTMRVTLKDANGNPLTGRTVAWSSSDPSVSIDQHTGAVTGVSQGQSTITATSEGKSGTATVRVVPVPVSTVKVEPVDTTIFTTTTAQMRVTLFDANNNPLTGRNVTWDSSNPLAATVSPTGLVLGLIPGSTTITATSEGKQGSTTVTVTLPPVGSVTLAPLDTTIDAGGTFPMRATVVDVLGNTVTDRPVSWMSDHPEFASIDPTSGVVTGVAAGTATITATSGTQSSSTTVTVNAPPPPTTP